MIKAGLDEYSVKLRTEELVSNLKNKEDIDKIGTIKTRKDIINAFSIIKDADFKNNKILILSDYEGQSEEIDIVNFANETISLFVFNNQIPDIQKELEENEKLLESDEYNIIEDLKDLVREYCNINQNGIANLEQLLEEIEGLKTFQVEVLEKDNKVKEVKEEEIGFEF